MRAVPYGEILFNQCLATDSGGATVGYIILEGDDTLELAAEVGKRMARGYRPLGGVACYYDPLRQAARYAQALVLDAAGPAESDAEVDGGPR